MALAKACAHLPTDPHIVVDYVLDSHLDMTDGFVHCELCDTPYLLEMVDLQHTTSLFRVSVLKRQAVADTIRSLQQGSCDIDRARNEVFSTANAGQPLVELLVKNNGVFTGLVRCQIDVPNQSWRSLPCDGRFIASLKPGRRDD